MLNVSSTVTSKLPCTAMTNCSIESAAVPARAERRMIRSELPPKRMVRSLPSLPVRLKRIWPSE